MWLSLLTKSYLTGHLFTQVWLSGTLRERVTKSVSLFACGITTAILLHTLWSIDMPVKTQLHHKRVTSSAFNGFILPYSLNTGNSVYRAVYSCRTPAPVIYQESHSLKVDHISAVYVSQRELDGDITFTLCCICGGYW